MPATVDDGDGSEDVTDFLKRIKELGDQRDREDEERTRRLEEEIIQGRKERQARREERARSLSPSKDSLSSAGTPASIRSKGDRLLMESIAKTPSLPTPSAKVEADEEPSKAGPLTPGNEGLEPNAKGSNLPELPLKPKSWQQRPSSRDPTTEGHRARSTVTLDERATRSQIAQSLGSKDPAWFRQTQDRGAGSAAYRQNLDDEKPSEDSRGPGVGLPGLHVSLKSRESPPPDAVPAASATASSGEAGSATSPRSTPPTAPSTTDSAQPLVPLLHNQKFGPSSDTSSFASDKLAPATRNYVMSPSQRGISPERMERPSSPTKGLGGFVQSAMMKRSDSVSKRWSAQPVLGLSRADSISSTRSGFEPAKVPFGSAASLGEPRSTRFSRESTPASTSRPGSAHSNVTVTPMKELTPQGASTSPNIPKSDSPGTRTNITTPPSRTDPPPSLQESRVETVTSLPTSPSKRWSPQKSSWLEKAINKPDSPKILSLSQPPEQPSWKADIARAKQQRGSVDLSKNSGHKEITTGGLMRAPPPAAGYKPPYIGGLASGVAPKPPRKLETSDDLGLPARQAVAKIGLPASKSLGQIGSTESLEDEEPPIVSHETTSKSKSSESAVAASGLLDPSTNPSELLPKQKPDTPPKNNIGSSLRPRQPSEGIKKVEPEFKNVFSKLKPTQIQRYKAPDELKDNIMRGKAGLAFTGGPKKTERKDEFKESILKKKQGMVAPSASTKITGAALQHTSPSLPEALQKQQGFQRSKGSETSDFRQPTRSETLDKPGTARNVEPKISPPDTKKNDSRGPSTDFASSLSGILQRGPPSIATENRERDSFSQTVQNSNDPTLLAPPDYLAKDGPHLTHATKSRARGPKRKPPTSTKSAVNDETPRRLVSTSESSNTHLADNLSHPTITPQRQDSRPLQNITNSNNHNRRDSQPLRKPSTSVKYDPKSPSLSSPKPDIVISPKPSTLILEKARTHPISPKPILPDTPPVTPYKMMTASVLPQPKNTILAEPSKSKTVPLPTTKPHSPPLPQKPTFFASPLLAQGKAVTPARTQHLDIAQLLSELFDEHSTSGEPIRINTQSILSSASSRDSFPKIKTLRKQIFEMVENGKTVSVPSHQEHILFEDSTYLCSHVFGTPAGQRMTEVYLWHGQDASSSAVEDAQLFAKRFAKDNGGRLIILQQGKETSSFFQALGGIVITRRGSSSRSGTSSPPSQYILRGRQHIGQVAFDEADFDPSSFCSGFAYIVSPGSGKLRLWKGKGASANEIGCARLIGMDLGTTGEIEEIDEGSEPKDFWSDFGSPEPTTTDISQYWQFKPSSDSYNLRLFSVDVETPRPKSASNFMSWGRRGSAPSPERNTSLSADIKEIVPFSQADLVVNGVLVLDAFFEIFVIHILSSLSPPPHRRSRQSAPFRAALLFAQEYAILAASAEDRPSVPPAKVVIMSSSEKKEGAEVPEALRCAFRKWNQRGKGCIVMSLPEVLEAVGVSREP